MVKIQNKEAAIEYTEAPAFAKASERQAEDSKRQV